MWRWSYFESVYQNLLEVFSTYVEVILWCLCSNIYSNCILHVCGGDPSKFAIIYFFRWYSPRMWRWSYDRSVSPEKRQVFSTYVEVILIAFICMENLIWILHVCGGDPPESGLLGGEDRYSPRMWRWSPPLTYIYIITLVFSTYVEVILTQKRYRILVLGILHVCGGDPIGSQFKSIYKEYSPRMWRWSHSLKAIYISVRVFSTYVEVILIRFTTLKNGNRILHVCGGDPHLRCHRIVHN